MELKNLSKPEQEMLRVFKIVYLLEAVKLEMEHLNPKYVKHDVYSRIHNIYKKITQFKAEINKNVNYDDIFDGVSNDKIHAMLTVMEKIIFLSEEQALKVEDMIQLEFDFESESSRA